MIVMIKWKKLRKQIKPYRFTIAMTALFVCLIAILLMFKLGGLTSGVSEQENNYIQSTASGRSIVNNPVYLAHKLPTYLVYKSGQNSIAFYRLVSVLWASVAVFALWALLKQWYSAKIAIIGAWLFICSAWSLHVSRQATFDVLYLSFLPLLWGILWSFRLQSRSKALLVMLACTAFSLYVPGLILLPVGIVLWKRKHLWSDFMASSSKIKTILVILLICSVVPITYAAISSPKILLNVLGLPVDMPGISSISNNFQELVKALSWSSNSTNPANWISGMPLLDAFSLVMLILGIYSLRFNYKIGRSKVLIAYAIISLSMIVAGSISIVALLPFIYLHIAGGVAFMLQQWFVVFPRNPVARTFGAVLITCAVVGVSFFHIYSYFVAWPQVPETRSAFSSIDLVQ